MANYIWNSISFPFLRFGVNFFPRNSSSTSMLNFLSEKHFSCCAWDGRNMKWKKFFRLSPLSTVLEDENYDLNWEGKFRKSSLVAIQSFSFHYFLLTLFFYLFHVAEGEKISWSCLEAKAIKFLTNWMLGKWLFSKLSHRFGFVKSCIF